MKQSRVISFLHEFYAAYEADFFIDLDFAALPLSESPRARLYRENRLYGLIASPKPAIPVAAYDFTWQAYKADMVLIGILLIICLTSLY